MSLRSAIATPDGKGWYVRHLFATIADRYDFITRLLSYGQDRRWKRQLVELAEIHPDNRVLDLACGTGDLLVVAGASGSRACGVDITFRMLQLAAEKQRVMATGGGRPTFLIAGDMLALPFRDRSWDVVTVGYGLRNVPDLQQAIAEIERVLTPGGRLLSLDFNRPTWPPLRAAYLLYLTIVGSVLGLALHRDLNTYRYIPESIRTYPGAARVARLLEQHGFTRVRVLPVLGGLMAIHIAEKPR